MLTTKKWAAIASSADSHPLIFEPLQEFPYIYHSTKRYTNCTLSDNEVLRMLLKSCDLTGERQLAAEREYYKEIKELYGETFFSRLLNCVGCKEEHDMKVESNTRKFMAKHKLAGEAKSYPILHKPTILRIKLHDFGVKGYGDGTMDVDDSILELSKKYDIILLEDIGEVLIHSNGFRLKRNRIFDPRFLDAHTHTKIKSEGYISYMYNKATSMVFEDNLMFDTFKDANATYTNRFLGN